MLAELRQFIVPLVALVTACGGIDAGATAGLAVDAVAVEAVAVDAAQTVDAPVAIDIPDPVTCLVERPTDEPVVPPAIDTCVPAGPDPFLNNVMPVLTSESHLGWLNPTTGLAEPYAPGAWAKLQPGFQGAGHAEMRLLVRDVAAPTSQPLVIEVAREVWTTCETRLAMGPTKIKLEPGSQPGWFEPAGYMATIVPMPPWMACGRWALFRTFWRKPGAESWHLAQVTVRMYLGAGAAAIPP